MDKLIILNFILIDIITGVLFLFKKFVKTDKQKYIALLFSAIATILCHYSSLPYHYFTDNTAMDYLRDNPNLVLPIYPCNVVMWSSLIIGIAKNKESKFIKFLIDYVFWFGTISSLVGMFANVDFIRNPNLLDFDITKGIISHSLLLFNATLLPTLGFIKVRLENNLKHILYSIIMMFVIGLYCNLLIATLVSNEFANHVNSMFILHSPFEAVPFLVYPFIAVVAFVLYFGVFATCEIFIYKKEDRWYKRIFSSNK